MTDEEKREILHKEIDKTQNLIVEYEELSQPIAPDSAIGRVSRMDAINNKSITESALREAKVNLKKLELVLSKVGTPDFGICMKCKKPIPLGRLLIKPGSLFCVNCAK